MDSPCRESRELGGTRGPDGASCDITVARAADLLGLSRSAAYRAATEGQLPTVRFGPRLKVSTPQLLALLGVGRDDGDAAPGSHWTPGPST